MWIQQIQKHRLLTFGVALLLLILIALFCVATGSVAFSLRDSFGALLNGLSGRQLVTDLKPNSETILLNIRAPRVLLAGLVGASLSVAGAAMQGLIKNPLADGSTLGVTSGGSLGAVIAIACGLVIPGLPGLSTTLFSILFSFISLLLILAFSHRIDANLSSNTIILTGVIFAMLTSSLVSLLIAFSGEQLQRIIFWTMGSFSGRGWNHLLLMSLFAVPGICGILLHARELDAFALGEEQAGYSGVNVTRVRFTVLTCVAMLCGAAVALCGSVAFIGLTIPHMARMLIGPAHQRLLPLSLLLGAGFLMLCDLFSRILLPPTELPIGVVTSIIGALTFIVIFYRSREVNR